MVSHYFFDVNSLTFECNHIYDEILFNLIILSYDKQNSSHHFCVLLFELRAVYDIKAILPLNRLINYMYKLDLNSSCFKMMFPISTSINI